MLNLGNINFGLGVNTTPLFAAVRVVQQFNAAVMRASNSAAVLSGRSTLAFAAIGTASTAAALSIARLGDASIRSSLQISKINARLLALSDLPQDAAVEFDRLRKVADHTGTSFMHIAEEWTNIKAAARGTSLEGEKAFQMFTNIANAAGAFRLSGDQVEGTFKAITQMMSKGVIQMEELRGQLGDRLPIAIRAMADAVGVSTKKLGDMAKAGELTTEKFLLPFSESLMKLLGTDPSKPVDSLQASITRLGNSMTFFNMAFDEAFKTSSLVKTVIEGLTSALDLMSANMDTVVAVIGAIAGALAGLALTKVVGLIISMTAAIQRAVIAMWAFNAATLANPAGALAMGIIKLSAALIGAEIGYAMMSKATLRQSEANDATIDSTQTYIDVQAGMKTAVKATTATFVTEVQKQIEATQIQLQALQAMNAQINKIKSPSQLSWGEVPGAAFGMFLDDIEEANNGLKNFLGIATDAKGAADSWSQAMTDESTRGRALEMDTLNRQMEKYKKQLLDLAAIGEKPAPGGKAEEDTIEKTSKEISELARRTKALRESAQDIEEYRQAIELYQGNPAFFEENRRYMEIADAVAAMRDRLIDAGVPLNQVNLQLKTLYDTLMQKDVVEQNFLNNIQPIMQKFEEIGTQAFNSVADAMAEMVVNGKLNAESMLNIVDAMVKELISSILKLAIINPILNSLFPGGTPLPMFGPAANTAPSQMGPSFLSDLAGKAAGGGRQGLTVNNQVINQTGANVRTEQSRNGGSLNIRTIISNEVKASLANGSADSPMRARYGVSPARVHRG